MVCLRMYFRVHTYLSLACQFTWRMEFKTYWNTFLFFLFFWGQQVVNLAWDKYSVYFKTVFYVWDTMLSKSCSKEMFKIKKQMKWGSKKPPLGEVRIALKIWLKEQMLKCILFINAVCTKAVCRTEVFSPCRECLKYKLGLLCHCWCLILVSVTSAECCSSLTIIHLKSRKEGRRNMPLCR